MDGIAKSGQPFDPVGLKAIVGLLRRAGAAKDRRIAFEVGEVKEGFYPGTQFVMVIAPDIAHAGHIGDEVTVTASSEHGVYVIFRSGIRECFPKSQFSALFRQRTSRPEDTDQGHPSPENK